MIRGIVLTLTMLASAAHACSMFTLSDGGRVLFGNNEDYTREGVIWFVPGAPGRFGRVNLGFDDDFAQGSMNDQGLCFDSAALPEVNWQKNPAKQDIPNLLEHIMDTCATVAQALRQFEVYNCHHLAEAQFMFADATGDAAVVAWDPRGHLSVERKQGRFLLMTNDRLEFSRYRDPRFVLGARLLEKAAPEVAQAREVLAGMHQCGKDVFTSYSNVFDLQARTIHLFNLTNFGEEVTFDLAGELAKGEHTLRLRKVFQHTPPLKEVTRRPARKHETEVTVAPEVLARYAGTYEVTDAAVKMVVSVDGNRGLMLRVNEQEPVALFPESETTFRFREHFGQITFKLSNAGTVEGLTLSRGGDAYARLVP